MRRLRKLLRAPFSFKMLLAEAFFRLLAVSIFLRLAPRPHLELHPSNHAKASLTAPGVPSSEDICKAVVIAAKYVPGATCLIRCLVARGMLARYGFTAQIRIGVLKDSSTFRAHAWLEKNGSILVGGDIGQYAQLGSPLNQ